MSPDQSQTLRWNSRSAPGGDFSADGGRATIVVADADPHLRDIYRTLLELHGYRVADAATGVEALDLARTLLPEIVLIDIDLPGLNGIDAVRILRESPTTVDTAVILLSVYCDPAVHRKALQAGCSGYIGKPFDSLQLVSEVRRVFRMTSRLRESAHRQNGAPTPAACAEVSRA